MDERHTDLRVKTKGSSTEHDLYYKDLLTNVTVSGPIEDLSEDALASILVEVDLWKRTNGIGVSKKKKKRRRRDTKS